MTNSSIFTRVFALALCVLMFAGVLTACFQNTESNPEISTQSPTNSTVGTTTGDLVENDPTEDPTPIDPNQIFSGSTTLANDALIYGTLANDVFIGGEDGIAAMIPADVKVEAGASSLALSIKKVEDANLADALSNLDVHISGVAADNLVPMTVKLGAVLPIGLSQTELKLYHIENDTPVLMTRVASANDFAIHNQYVYDEETGDVTIYVASFSTFSAVQVDVDVWDGETVAEGFASGDGTEENPYIIETAAQLVYFRNQVDAGVSYKDQFVKLNKDIDLNNINFDPIGFGYTYNKDSDTAFMGTFDGGNHTIYNLYQNGWDLDPDKTNYGTYTYSTAGGGLFASIENATIKNLVVSGADIVFECVDIGIVVGYAQGDCHFENIVVTNSKIANYNRATGAVVGEVCYGSYGTDKTKGYSHTFKNIVVDSTVVVSSLWGSFDTLIGGVIGGKWGDATVKMENVITAAELDVYSDVTAAYQWYAYRRCGMLIGHTEQNSPKSALNADAPFLKCTNVNVYYGDWVNYEYYEFENQDSGTGQRYPWVRAQVSPVGNNGAFSNPRYGVPTHNGVKVTELDSAALNGVATDYTPIVFNQLYGGGQGVYGTNEHDGVIIYNNLERTKTIYILNNADWENLKLQYWFRNGDDTWTTNIDGIDMSAMYLSSYNVYKIELPAYVDGFRIVADSENSVEFTLANLTDGETYTVGGDTHEHDFGDGNKCECGAYKIQKGELVTDINDLNASDKIIIVAANSSVALSTTQNSNNRKQVAIVKNEDGTVTINANVQIITLEAGSINGTFAFNVGDGYLYAASSSANHLKTQNDKTDDGSWLITIENGVATIKAQGEYTRNWLMHNATSSIFSCYASGQQDVAIYKLSANEEIVEVHDCKEFAFGATCKDNAICSQCSSVIEDSALGHDYVGKETAPTCTDAGYTTYNCSRCDESYKEDGADALGHEYIDGICHCGAVESAVMDFSGRYYIATIRTTGNYFYMTNTLGTASTKRYQAIDSGLTTLPGKITNGESDKIFVLEKNEDGTYSIYAEGIDGNNYLGWTSENSGILVAKKDALKLTVDKKEDGTYNIHFTGDSERYLALNQSSGSNYFAWYKSGQKQDLALIPINNCEHNYNSVVTNPTCTENGYTTYTCTECGYSYTDNTVTATGHNYVDGTCTGCGESQPTEHTCESVCATCNKCTDKDCTEDACTNKCEGHTATPTWTLTEIANIKADDIVVIVWTTSNGTYAMTNNNGTGSAPAAVKVTISGDKLTGDIADNIKWNISNNNGTLTIYPNGTTATWLYCTSTNNGVRVGTNTNKTFTIDATSGYLKHTGTNRYLGVYNAQDVRCYTSPDGTNIKNQTLSFYVYNTGTSGGNGGNEGGGTPETPACQHTNTTTNTVNATCTTAGSITVTCTDCGKTVSTETIESTGHNYVDGTCSVCGEADPNAGGSTTTQPVTETMNIYANKGTTGTNTISWTSGNITVTNNKASSSTAIRTSDSDHFRVYQGNKTTISAANITKIVITITESKYVSACKASLEAAGYNVTTDGNTVSVIFDSVNSIEFTASAQWRLSSITVTYTPNN